MASINPDSRESAAENPLRFPSQFLFSIDGINDLYYADYAAALSQAGIIQIELNFADPDASIMKSIVEYIGKIDTHDQQGTAIWDVKYDSNVDPEKGTRSHTMLEFSLHTDACFELQPPQYVALYVVAEDRLGGGVTQLVDGRELLQHLDGEAIAILQRKSFKFKVPPEFMKQQHFIEAAILDERGNFRYRQEVLLIDNCSPEELRAIARLESLLQNHNFIQSIFLKTGTIIIFDNGRFLHGRTKVKDKNRHLKRIRSTNPIPPNPPCKGGNRNQTGLT
jgi:alpha-ketoglutarate-dependent taurine dioxygenase